jgi:hypothetical protein
MATVQQSKKVEVKSGGLHVLTLQNSHHHFSPQQSFNHGSHSKHTGWLLL